MSGERKRRRRREHGGGAHGSRRADHRAGGLPRAGNAAVVAALRVQRQGGGQALPLNPRVPGSLAPRPGMVAQPPLPMDLRDAIRAWLESARIGIGMQVEAGTTSMPEVVARIRRDVPGTADVPAWQVGAEVRQVMGRLTPPQTRGRETPAGRRSELVARLENLFGARVQVGDDDTGLVVSLSGAVARAALGAVDVRAEAGAGGVEGSVTVADRVTATASPGEFGLRASIPMGDRDGVFGAKLSRVEGAWTRWQASFSLPLVGRSVPPARPTAAALESSVVAAEAAFHDIAAHLQAGGHPTDPEVVELIGKVTPAISRVGAAVREPEGPRVGLRATAGAGPREVGGRTVREATVGLSLVIEF